jgi:c(7)-type cytochrome triheme protein
MRKLILSFAVLFVIGGLGLVAQEKKAAPTAPAKLTFEAKQGNVTYDHAKHAKREKDKCTVCHDALFPQKKAPLNFKAGMHKPAEAKKTSCGFCHHPGGTASETKAFETKGNCTKCHVKAAVKPAD